MRKMQQKVDILLLQIIMNIKRINFYSDPRFTQEVLNQHGCFLVDGEPYEVEIISDSEAVIRGRDESIFPAVIDEFRFYTPHITRFYDENQRIIQEFPPVALLTIPLGDIQPSQFYIDEDKIAAIRSFIHSEEDIIIQVLRHGRRYISLDGHTRLYYAVMMGWQQVRAVEETSDDYIYGFVEEAVKRNIRTPYDLKLVSHPEYEEKWHKFCDDYFAEREG